MTNIWKKLCKKWRSYWEDDEFDSEKKHLSQYDKRSLLYGGYVISGITLALCLFIMGMNNIRISQENDAALQKMLGTISTYLATATEDEYDKIAQTIRHDLVFSRYGKDMETYIRYIPNTADECCLEWTGYSERVYLVFLNTGELYGLDIYERGETSETTEQKGATMFAFGYDEISESRITILKRPGEGVGEATLYREQGIVSLHKMKGEFCDDCIREILNTVEDEFISEAVLYDTEEKMFYPITEGVLQLAEYEFQITYEHGDYKMEIAYIG